MISVTHSDVLQVARQLPLSEQAAIAEELLEKNRRVALDALLAEADRVALLKARARYTLEASGLRSEKGA